MNPSLQSALNLGAPFPGLRAFEAEESLLFYGRETHVAELLNRLGDSHFVAVTGTSGSGKSSLVRAGLRPALQRGYLIDATSRWRFATLRPGSAPITALAGALAGALDGQPLEEITELLHRTSAGLSHVVSRAGLAAGESLLIIADQFEELFRFDVTSAQQGEAALFVSQLLEATERRSSPVYVVVTMRSEFLGRSSEFSGLAEAFNRSQYLVPRLTRDERRQAIERPLRLFGTEPSPALVQQVLNDAGDDPDQLPVMQHALLRTYREWEQADGEGRIERHHYETVGLIEQAIDRHAEEMLSRFDEAAGRTVERLFRSLTVTQAGVALRRPRTLRELYAIAGAVTADGTNRVDTIVSTFADRQNAFLMLSSPSLTPETVVDITHESVIRKWNRLKAWVREESRSSEWYADLARDVVRHRNGTAGLWQDPALNGILQRRRDEDWNEAWANQYRRADDPLFADVVSFLDASASERARQQHEEEEQRDRELRQAQALARSKRIQSIGLASLLVLVVIAALLQSRVLSKDRQIAQAAADRQRLTSDNQRIASQLSSLEAARTELLRQSAAPNTAPGDEARNQQKLQQLSKDIEAAKAQAQSNLGELGKLRKDQELNASDRGKLVTQVETLQQQLSAVQAERDKLQTQVNSRPPSTQPVADDRVKAIQRQLDDERGRGTEAASEIARLKSENASLRAGSAVPPANVSAQDLTRTFTEGVRAYELKDWPTAMKSMQAAIGMQGGVKQPPKEVRMSGTRLVPYAPYSYLGAALFEMKADCTAMAAALKPAENEAAPSDIRGRLQAARAQCAGR